MEFADVERKKNFCLSKLCVMQSFLKQPGLMLSLTGHHINMP